MSHKPRRSGWRPYAYYLLIAAIVQWLFPERANVLWVFPLLVLLYHTERIAGRKFLGM